MSMRGRDTDAPVSVLLKARSCASMHSRMVSTRLTVSLSINNISRPLAKDECLSFLLPFGEKGRMRGAGRSNGGRQ
jgi:hypothetical protein